MTKKQQGVLDDSLPGLKITDYSGGLNTMEGAFNLSSNETPDCQNVIGFPGRCLYVGGTNNITALAAIENNGDGGIQFYDNNNNKHIVAWVNGNMYETVNGIKTLIATAIYTPGQNIGRTVLDSILYWSTINVPMRQYDGTTEGPVITSAAVGSVAIPASNYLCTFAGSIIAANPVIAGSPNPGSIIPSNVNDPTTFLGANQSTLGNNNFIQALIPMSTAAGGIPPTSSIMCLGTVGLVLAQGAVNALKLQNINYPIGCQDGNSVVYIPTGDILGNVIYLGTDNQFHESNGITTKMISSKILNLMNALISNSLALNVRQRFSGTYNKNLHYYLCDMGSNVQIVYKWTRMPDDSIKSGFFRINGWPSGMYFDGTSGNGLPTNYVVSSGSLAAGVYQVGIDGVNFNGIQPVVYYATPYMHAGDISMMKEWQWINLTFNCILPTSYMITPTGLTNSANVTIAGNVATFNSPTNLSNSGGVWDASQWDNALWANIPALPTQLPAIDSIMTTATAVDGLGNTINCPLRSSAVSYKIAWNPITPIIAANFDITNFGIRYLNMGHYMTGGSVGSAEAI